MFSRVSLSLFVLLAAGCSLFGGDDPEIELQTDQSTYTPNPDEVISLRIENRSDDPIFFICTGQIYLEEIRDDEVTARWMIHGFEECLSPVPIEAEEVEEFELGFDEKSALGNLQDARFDSSVRYRLTVDLFWDQAFNRRLSDKNSRSNSFQIIRNPVL